MNRCRKANVSVIFVYLVSTIFIIFAGFLVVKFVTGLDQSAKQAEVRSFFNDFEIEMKKVKNDYGSMNSKRFNLPSEARMICLVEDAQECSYSLLRKFGDTVNLVLLEDQDSVLEARRLYNFTVKTSSNENVGCLCEQIGSSRQIEILFRNVENSVQVQPLEQE